MAVFAGQFVPLKLVTDGNPEWSRFTRQYPVEGNGIPRLYVIRADGKKLYAGVGSLVGDALPRMLVATLQGSGRSFNDAETALLKSSVAAAEEAMKTKNAGKAAAELSKLARLGTVGELKSYSEPALKANKMAAQLIELSDAMIKLAVAKLDDSETAFTGALALADYERQYAGFAKVKSQVLTSMKTAKRNNDLKPFIAQAEALARARRLAESEKATFRKKAPEAYEIVIRRYPGTQADTLARHELATISPNGEVLSEAELTTKPTLRTWTDSLGKFTVRATLVKLESDKVTLKRENGAKIIVPIEKLSKSDQAFLRGVTR